MEELLAALLQAGVIDIETAGVIERQGNLEAARVWAEDILTNTTLGALSEQQRRLLNFIQDTERDPRAGEWDQFWAREDELLFEAITPDIYRIVTERATLSVVANGGTFNFATRTARNWALNHYLDPEGFGSIPNLNGTSREQVALAFADWTRGRLGTRGLPDLINALVPTFGPTRARTIGVTETTRIFVESQRAAQAGNPLTVGFRWQTSFDERVCPICGPRHGNIRRKEAGYSGGTDIPAHPRCRCHESPETAGTLGQLPGPETRPDLIPPPIPGTVPEGEQAPFFAKTKDAQEWAQARFSFTVNYGKLDAGTANAINQSLLNNLNSVPRLSGSVRYVGSSQARNQDIKAHFRPEVEKSFRDLVKGDPAWTDKRIKAQVDKRLNQYATRIPGRVYAYSHGARPGSAYVRFQGINVNEKFGKNFVAMETSLASDVAQGYHPIGTGTVKAVIDHELGHEIDKLYGLRTDPGMLDIIKQIEAMPGGISDNLSRYATTNKAEVIAEAWAEYLNNPTPREPARMIGEYMLNKAREP